MMQKDEAKDQERLATFFSMLKKGILSQIGKQLRSVPVPASRESKWEKH